VIIVSIDRNKLEQMQGGISGDQLNFVRGRVVMHLDRNDFDAKLSVGLHEATAADVAEDLVDLREGDGVDRTEAIRCQEFANGESWHRVVTDVQNHKSFETQVLSVRNLFSAAS
jgi:hypothetical protein